MNRLADIAIEAQKSPDRALIDALNSSDSITEAAESLGVSRSAMTKWIAKLNIQKRYVLPETKNAPESCNES